MNDYPILNIRNPKKFNTTKCMFQFVEGTEYGYELTVFRLIRTYDGFGK